MGPVTARTLSEQLGVSVLDVDLALLALEAEGFAMRGGYTAGAERNEWCERRLLARINRYTVKRLRNEIEPVGAADFMRFLLDWQHTAPDERMEGPGCGGGDRLAAGGVRSSRVGVGSRDSSCARLQL